MDLIDRLMETKRIPDTHYKINWLGGFEINPRDQAAGHSVNKICRDIGIGKQTFYSWAEKYGLKR